MNVFVFQCLTCGLALIYFAANYAAVVASSKGLVSLGLIFLSAYLLKDDSAEDKKLLEHTKNIDVDNVFNTYKGPRDKHIKKISSEIAGYKLLDPDLLEKIIKSKSVVKSKADLEAIQSNLYQMSKKVHVSDLSRLEDLFLKASKCEFGQPICQGLAEVIEIRRVQDNSWIKYLYTRKMPSIQYEVSKILSFMGTDYYKSKVVGYKSIRTMISEVETVMSDFIERKKWNDDQLGDLYDSLIGNPELNNFKMEPYDYIRKASFLANFHKDFIDNLQFYCSTKSALVKNLSEEEMRCDEMMSQKCADTTKTTSGLPKHEQIEDLQGKLFGLKKEYERLYEIHRQNKEHKIFSDKIQQCIIYLKGEIITCEASLGEKTRIASRELPKLGSVESQKIQTTIDDLFSLNKLLEFVDIINSDSKHPLVVATQSVIRNYKIQMEFFQSEYFSRFVTNLTRLNHEEKLSGYQKDHPQVKRLIKLLSQDEVNGWVKKFIAAAIIKGSCNIFKDIDSQFSDFAERATAYTAFTHDTSRAEVDFGITQALNLENLKRIDEQRKNSIKRINEEAKKRGVHDIVKKLFDPYVTQMKEKNIEKLYQAFGFDVTHTKSGSHQNGEIGTHNSHDVYADPEYVRLTKELLISKFTRSAEIQSADDEDVELSDDDRGFDGEDSPYAGVIDISSPVAQGISESVKATMLKIKCKSSLLVDAECLEGLCHSVGFATISSGDRIIGISDRSGIDYDISIGKTTFADLFPIFRDLDAYGGFDIDMPLTGSVSESKGDE